MTWIKTTLPAVVAAGALAAAALGLGSAVASADPVPQPPTPLEAQGGEIPPPNAPPKPAEMWDGAPVVWISGWGGRWGVWKNGYFITLSSNINTGGG
jgi:hypothetical protein